MQKPRRLVIHSGSEPSPRAKFLRCFSVCNSGRDEKHSPARILLWEYAWVSSRLSLSRLRHSRLRSRRASFRHATGRPELP